MNRFALAVLSLGCTIGIPLAASAQMSPHMAMSTFAHAEAGVIQSIQGSSLTLADGRTVFLHQGTIIKPTGLRLAPGMRIAIRGDRDGRERFNASRIDRRGTRGYRETMARIHDAHATFMGGEGF